MAETLSTAPILSTPDDHLFDQPEVAIAEPTLSDDEFRIRYEIDRTLSEIKAQRWKRIALQFPDHMLSHSAKICQTLSQQCNANSPRSEEEADQREVNGESSAVKFTILADTSYGSCCVDEIAAEHVDADAVIHYGRACLSPTSRLPVLHVFTKLPLDLEAAIQSLTTTFADKSTSIVLTSDIPYSHHIQPLCQRLESQGYTSIHAAEIIHDPSSAIPNRTLPQSVIEDPTTLSSWHVYHISTPPTSLLLTLASKTASIRVYDPDTTISTPEATTSLLLRRRYATITQMSTTSTWGILINTLSVKHYMHMLNHIQRQLANAGKKSYLFVVGKLNPAKVANFAEIGGWVVIGCWESSLIDSRDFLAPILTPFELDLVLKGDSRIWTGEWRADFDGVLQNEQPEEIDNEDDSDDAPPEFDLRTGRYVTQSRPMGRRRLQPSGKDPGSKALSIRSKGDIVSVNGVASPAAEYLAQKRSWKGLGSDFEIKYDEEEVEGAIIEQGRQGVARGYTVGESARS